MRFPRNLTQRAFDDYSRIVRHSLSTFGPITASRTSEKLLARCRQIEDGTAPGRRHPDIPFKGPIRYLALSPFLIFYDDQTRVAVRILDGRRDLPTLFIDDLD
jgi:plasmid stabilization system protein ParE